MAEMVDHGGGGLSIYVCVAIYIYVCVYMYVLGALACAVLLAFEAGCETSRWRSSRKRRAAELPGKLGVLRRELKS